jgi:Protein of unknown function (DUF1759)
MADNLNPSGFYGHPSNHGSAPATSAQTFSVTNGDEDEIMSRLEPVTNPDGSFDSLFRRYSSNIFSTGIQMPSIQDRVPCMPSSRRESSLPLIPELASNIPSVVVEAENNTMNDFIPNHQSSYVVNDPFDISQLQINESERLRLRQLEQSLVGDTRNSTPPQTVGAYGHVSRSQHQLPLNEVPQGIPYGSASFNAAVPNVYTASNLQVNMTAPPVCYQAPSENRLPNDRLTASVNHRPAYNPSQAHSLMRGQNVLQTQQPLQSQIGPQSAYQTHQPMHVQNGPRGAPQLHHEPMPMQTRLPSGCQEHVSTLGQSGRQTNLSMLGQGTSPIHKQPMFGARNNAHHANMPALRQSAFQGAYQAHCPMPEPILQQSAYQVHLSMPGQNAQCDQPDQRLLSSQWNRNLPAYSQFQPHQVPLPGWNLAQSNPQQVVYYPQPRRYTQRDYPQLQSFTGQKPEEWPSWIAYFHSTTVQYAIPPHENFERIKKAIATDSPAHMAVRHLLHLPTEGDTIIQVLQDFFGQPHFILQKLKEKAEKFPQITDDRMDRLLALCADVENLVATLRTCAGEAHMVEGSLLNILVKKLPVQLQLQWGGSQHYGLQLASFNNWLKSIRPSAIRIIDQPLGASAWQQSKSSSSSTAANKRINSHQRIDGAPKPDETESLTSENTTQRNENFEVKAKGCKVCSSEEKHHLGDCTAFREKSVDGRWKTVRALKVCFCCLNHGHGSNKCTKKSCEIDGCQKKTP